MPRVTWVPSAGKFATFKGKADDVCSSLHVINSGYLCSSSPTKSTVSLVTLYRVHQSDQIDSMPLLVLAVT